MIICWIWSLDMRKRGVAPTPWHVEEVPPPIDEEPQELEEENVVYEIGVGVANPEPISKLQQLSQAMRS
jgi:hypothetical protein